MPRLEAGTACGGLRRPGAALQRTRALTSAGAACWALGAAPLALWVRAPPARAMRPRASPARRAPEARSGPLGFGLRAQALGLWHLRHGHAAVRAGRWRPARHHCVAIRGRDIRRAWARRRRQARQVDAARAHPVQAPRRQPGARARVTPPCARTPPQTQAKRPGGQALHTGQVSTSASTVDFWAARGATAALARPWTDEGGGSDRGGAGAAHRSRCSLWPSWPLTPRPQEKTSPLARPSSVWRQPHASIATSPPSRPPTRLGSGLSAVSPVPSCPNCARSRARVSAGAGGPHARGRLLSACCAAAAPGPD